MEKYENSPSASQAIRLKQHSKAKALTQEIADDIMAEVKKEPIKVTLIGSKLRQYFSANCTPKQMEDVILRLLDGWLLTQQVPWPGYLGTPHEDRYHSDFDGTPT